MRTPVAHALSCSLAAAAALACAACADVPAQAGDDGAVVLSFRPDEVKLGSEGLLCFGFDPSQLAGRAVERVTWSAPAGGGVSLHHATLFAVEAPFPDGPRSCLAMPKDAQPLHKWAPGDQPLVMPEGFALTVPEATRKIVIQAHVLREAAAPAAVASVALTLAASPPEHLAAWHSTSAKVPPIPPHGQAHTTSGCLAQAEMHALFAWPHMHRFGTTFHSAVQRRGGGRVPLVDVAAWDVNEERIYPVAVDIGQGDVIEIACSWSNPTDSVVTYGLYTTNEMCTHGIISWPADAPRCKPL